MISLADVLAGRQRANYKRMHSRTMRPVSSATPRQSAQRSVLDALSEAASRGEALVGKKDKYGQRYVVDFPFAGPIGSAMIRSAWIIRTGENVPRLVTCYIL